MALQTQIDQDLTAAMKAGEAARTAVLRLLKNALKNEQIKLRHELSDDEALKVVQREAKQRREAIALYRQGGRTDLEQSEQQELEVIQTYLPQQMSAADLEQLVDKVIADTKATGVAQMGAVIGAVLQQSQGRADGGAVSALVRQKLS